jgi:hypothetical protein
VEGIDLGGVLIVLLVLVELADRVAGPGRGEESKAAIDGCRLWSGKRSVRPHRLVNRRTFSGWATTGLGI